MTRLQATWTPEGQLFFWSPEVQAEHAIDEDLPYLSDVVGEPVQRVLTVPGPPQRRRKQRGFDLSMQRALPVLAALPRDADVSDTIRCWSYAARLGLELASRQRVVPTVQHHRARWRVLLNRRPDRERFEVLARSLPVAARLVPTDARGPLRLHTSHHTLRAFLDEVVDTLFRQNAWPGTSRGWAREFAEALRGDESAFTPRSARYQGIPDKIAIWASEGELTGLRVGMTLGLPNAAGERFPVELWMHPSGEPEHRIPLDAAWRARKPIPLDGRLFHHAAHAAIRDLARAKHLFPPIGQALRGKRPRALAWDANATWDFLREGAPRLREAGFEVELPEAFAEAGNRRIRARMHLQAGTGDHPDLSGTLDFRWEVTLGDLVLSGDDFAELVARRKPIVQFRGEWVLLDPAELARLPDGLPNQGRLGAAEALRALLTGTHDGIPVVADDRLAWVIEALRSPPEAPLPARFHGELRPYQHRGLSWLTTLGDLGLGACLGDDMGLGKTVQLIAHLLLRAERRQDRPTLVVCPTSVLGNWTREIERFAPSLRVVRYHGSRRSVDDIQPGTVVLTTYGLLVRDAEELAHIAWDVVVLDEGQSIKNPDSQRARAARGLKARQRIALTGTPVENRLQELWSILEFLIPGLLGPRAAFERNVAVPIERFGDEEVAERLKLGVSPFLLRRLKTDPTIITDLPEKFERRLYTPLTGEQARLYEQTKEEALERISEAADVERRGHVFAMLTALKQICNHPAQYLHEEGPLSGRSGKLERLEDLLEIILESDEQAIVFTQYREMGSLLQGFLTERFQVDIPFLHGGVPTERRDEMVLSFQSEDGPPVLLVSLRAGGTGLNLTRATHVIHYDRWWNPAVEDQATDRAYRIGQRRDVQVHKLVCQGTLEERIDRILEEKRNLAESVVGTGESLVAELDDAALRALVALGEDAVMEDA